MSCEHSISLPESTGIRDHRAALCAIESDLDSTRIPDFFFSSKSTMNKSMIIFPLVSTTYQYAAYLELASHGDLEWDLKLFTFLKNVLWHWIRRQWHFNFLVCLKWSTNTQWSSHWPLSNSFLLTEVQALVSCDFVWEFILHQTKVSQGVYITLWFEIPLFLVLSFVQLKACPHHIK